MTVLISANDHVVMASFIATNFHFSFPSSNASTYHCPWLDKVTKHPFLNGPFVILPELNYRGCLLILIKRAQNY